MAAKQTKVKKVPTIQLVDPELRVELDRVSILLGEEAPALLRRIIRRGLRAESVINTTKTEPTPDAVKRVRSEHYHILAFLADRLGPQQAAAKPAQAESTITFDASGFGADEEI